MKISRNTVATVSFIVTDEENKVVGRTDPKKPVVTLVGHHYLVPGLEKAIDGHEKGDEFTVTLNPADSYGEFDETLVQTIPRTMFGDFPIEEGQVFEADTNHGPRAVVVKEIRETEVVVDGNHPLSGKTLNFFVCIEDVREATAEEIAHGHVHPNGVCPSEEGEHHCCCGHHHHDADEGEGEHHCCCGHHHHDAEKAEDSESDNGKHKCGCGHHHHDAEEGEGEHHCCCGHHHHDAENAKEGEAEGEHHCCCGHHHDK